MATMVVPAPMPKPHSPLSLRCWRAYTSRLADANMNSATSPMSQGDCRANTVRSTMPTSRSCTSARTAATSSDRATPRRSASEMPALASSSAELMARSVVEISASPVMPAPP